MGQTIYGFGFGGNNGQFTVTAVGSQHADRGRATERPVTEVGSGDEALVTQGSRGVLLDTFFASGTTPSLNKHKSRRQPTSAAYGTAPSMDFNGLLDHLISLGSTPSVQQSAPNYTLPTWPTGATASTPASRVWADFGLNASEAVFDFQSLRDAQTRRGSFGRQRCGP